MTENTNNDELIERYLLGDLSGNLLDDFKEKLAADEKFRKEVALQRSIIHNIKIAGRKDWAAKLDILHKEMYSLTRNRRKRYQSN